MSARTATLLAAAALALGAWVGCTNDPFDPSTLPNSPPVARIFVTSPVGGDLNSTSYYQRTFHWSGTDPDGFVTGYHVTIETEEGVSAPWVSTTRTDTTMTFTTDDEGEARALIRVACVDDRGAVSDTVSQFIPLRNFPPVINFVSDYDTTFWSFASASFRFFALDLDGAETMDDSVTFFLDTADTLLPVLGIDEPGADPALRRVRKPIDSLTSGTFELEFHGNVPPGQRTLNVQVGDEADATAHFTWTWEALEALGPVLLMDDFAGTYDEASYHAVMDSVFGEGQWSRYDLEDGLPDRLWVFSETLSQFDCLFWYTGTSTSDNLIATHQQVAAYLDPTDPEVEPGRMLLVSKPIIGGNGNVPPSFLQVSLGINRVPAPPAFFIPQNRTVRKYDHDLWEWDDDGDDQWEIVAFRPINNVNGSVGLSPMATAEAVYRMEYHRYNPRPPYEPYVGVRRPTRDVSEYAKVVTLTLQFEHLNREDVVRELRYLLGEELGVELP